MTYGVGWVFGGGRPMGGRVSTALTAVLCLAIVFGGTPGFVSGAPGSGGRAHRAYVAQEGLAGDVIVVLEDGADVQAAEAVEIAVDAGGEQPAQVFDTVIDGFATTLTAAEVTELATDPQVAGIFPNIPVAAAAQTLPTGVDRVDADANPTANINGVDTRVNVGVAVFDSGIASHPDLNVVGGKDCSGPDTGSFSDDFVNGHGTHVAGTIGALDNGIGVVGVAPGASLYAVKVLDSAGNGDVANILCGLDWVAQNAGMIDIVNMSLSTTDVDDLDPADRNACGNTTPFHQAVCNTVNVSGIPVVVAAGNSGGNADNYVPATYPEVIAVSGISDSDGQPGGDSRAGFSNFGADIDIAAPATQILSTNLDGGLRSLSGTSMAAAHASGALALSLVGGGDIFSNARFPGQPGGVTGVSEGVLCVGPCGQPQAAAMTLSPTRTTVNVQVVASLSGFPANASVTVAFVGTSYRSSTSVTTNGSGVATASLPVPATPQGRYTIRATSGGTVVNRPFDVAPRIKVTPATGDPGDTVNVSLRGFGKRDSVRIRWRVGNSYVTLTTVTASNSGSSNVNVQVPGNAPGGPTAVRGDGTIARAQTNVFFVGGSSLRVAEAGTPAASPVAGTPVASPVTGSPVASASEASPVAATPEGSPAVEAVEPTPEATVTVEPTVAATAEAATEVPTEAPTEIPTEIPTTAPTDVPTEAPTEIPTAVPTETPAPTPTPEVMPYAVVGDASSDPNVPGWVVSDSDELTYWEVLAPVPVVPEQTGEGTPEVFVEPVLGPDGLPLPAASLVLDLGSWLPIGSVRWVYAVEGGADDLRIEASEDGVYWTPITYPRQVGNAPPGEWQELTFAPGSVGGRYVRFAFENPNGDVTLGGMAEIEVWP